ncbi:hypothetical protein AB1Y20_018869 [Prymnesium parvum]|uniref:Uncharacterized protein n=1 Tax=Prymnesium parvum TaxID=97485 RepID=A0AB34JPP9_PRYPA
MWARTLGCWLKHLVVPGHFSCSVECLDYSELSILCVVFLKGSNRMRKANERVPCASVTQKSGAFFILVVVIVIVIVAPFPVKVVLACALLGRAIVHFVLDYCFT